MSVQRAHIFVFSTIRGNSSCPKAEIFPHACYLLAITKTRRKSYTSEDYSSAKSNVKASRRGSFQQRSLPSDCDLSRDRITLGSGLAEEELGLDGKKKQRSCPTSKNGIPRTRVFNRPLTKIFPIRGQWVQLKHLNNRTQQMQTVFNAVIPVKRESKSTEACFLQ